MSKRLTTEEWITKAKKVHGNRYDYSKVLYKQAKTNVTIICRVHGPFPQSPDAHARGQGCPLCNQSLLTTDTFMERAHSVHGDKYDYSLANYTNMYSSLTIICPTHGEFPQQANNHLQGMGCRRCAYDLSRKTREEFVAESLVLHSGKYNYSKVEYRSTEIDVVILCPIHGEFEQKPNNHLHGRGCPKCAEYGYNPAKDGTFYIYVGDFLGFGVSNDFKTRSSHHATNFKKHEANLVLHKTYDLDGETTLNLETAIKRTFKHHIVNTGIDGFKTEALPMEHLRTLEKFVENWLTQQELERKIEPNKSKQAASLREVDHVSSTHQENYHASDREQRPSEHPPASATT